jgi:hypothetical protein
MAVARTFPEIRNDCAFELRALYALTGDDVPVEIRDEFLAQAERGEVVTYEQVKEALSRPPIREVQVNVTETHHFITVERYVPDPAIAAYPVLEAGGTLPAVDVDSDTGEANQTAYVMVKTVADTAVQETSRGEAPGAAQFQPLRRIWRLDQVRRALQELLATPPDVIASDWLTGQRQGDAVEIIRDMGQQLLAYADAMEAARPPRLRLVTNAGNAS